MLYHFVRENIGIRGYPPLSYLQPLISKNYCDLNYTYNNNGKRHYTRDFHEFCRGFCFSLGKVADPFFPLFFAKFV